MTGCSKEVFWQISIASGSHYLSVDLKCFDDGTRKQEREQAFFPGEVMYEAVCKVPLHSIRKELNYLYWDEVLADVTIK